MAIRDKYFTGSTVSRYLPPGEHSWDEAVYQSGKPVLDAELNLSQEVGRQLRSLVQQRTVPSGWLRGPVPPRFNEGISFLPTSNPNFAPNTFWMGKRTALVAGAPIVVEFSNTDLPNINRIDLDAATVYEGTGTSIKRTDFVFLEVWRCLVSHSPRASATVEVVTWGDLDAADQILINAVVLQATTGGPALNTFNLGLNANETAANIAAAINEPLNAFTGICTAAVDVSDPTQVNLTTVDALAGAAGNAVTLSLALTNAGSMTVNAGPGPTTFAGGADTPNKPTQFSLYRNGNVQSPLATNLPDEIADPTIGTETTKRVQWQYRIRATGAAEGVNFKTQHDGFSQPNVQAQGSQAAPLGALFPFVKADMTSVIDNSSAVAYDIRDPGLWVSGDGTSASATALGTVDGYVYAVPIGFVFRRNDAYNGGVSAPPLGQGFSPLDNTNGGLPFTHPLFVNPYIGTIEPNESDRPDGQFHDVISDTDFLDLRKNVYPGGIDLKAELERQMGLVLDNTLGTWAIDSGDKSGAMGGGSGDVSWKYMVCNEIGRADAEGGNPQNSGDTLRGNFIANFDHVRRRFGDQAVVELRVFPILPTDIAINEPGKFVIKDNPATQPLCWAEDDVIHIDLGSLNATGDGTWAEATETYHGGSGGFVSNFFPSGTLITGINTIRHDDGQSTAVVVPEVQMKLVTGLGTDYVQITLDRNDTPCDGGGIAGYPGTTISMSAPTAANDTGSPRRIFVELEITYPVGSGTSDTPWLDANDESVVPDAPTSVGVYDFGPAVEDGDVSQRPPDFNEQLPPLFRPSHREIQVEYACGDPGAPGSAYTDILISADPLNITVPRRMYGSKNTEATVTDLISGTARAVDHSTTHYGMSSRRLVLNDTGTAPAIPLTNTGSTPVTVNWWPQDPIPNSGGSDGYQLAFYYRTQAEQTVGSQTGIPSLPENLVVEPLVMARSLWTNTVSVGSVDVPFPYLNPSDQIPVNADTPVNDFPGEWALQATADISVMDFDADVGILNLHQMVPVANAPEFDFRFPDKDVEFRSHYKFLDTNAYRPTAMAQPLSGIATHKVSFPFLARVTSGLDGTAGSTLWRENEVILLVVTRYAILDEDNTVLFTDGAGNRTCVGVYRTEGLTLLASE